MSNAVPEILIVEDEPQMRRFLRAGFELEGFRVSEAETASSGVRLATLSPFDMIVVDHVLPVHVRKTEIDEAVALISASVAAHGGAL